jgi:hypothetical protein
MHGGTRVEDWGYTRRSLPTAVGYGMIEPTRKNTHYVDHSLSTYHRRTHFLAHHPSSIIKEPQDAHWWMEGGWGKKRKHCRWNENMGAFQV